MLACTPASLPFTIAEDVVDETVNDAPPLRQQTPPPQQDALAFLEVDAGTALTLLEAAVTHCAYAHPPPARLRQLAAQLETLAERRERRAALTLTRCLRRVGKGVAHARRTKRALKPRDTNASRARRQSVAIGKAKPSKAEALKRRASLARARAPVRPRLNRAAELAARAGQKKREAQEKRAEDARRDLLGGGWCGAARPAWVDQDEALSRKIEAGLTGKREDDALSPLRASNSPSSKAEKAATAWLRKARSGDVPLDVAEVEAVVAVLRRCRGVIPDDAKDAAPMTLAEARRCLKKAVAQLVAGDASVEVEVERWDAVVRGHPEYVAEQAARREAWDAANADANAQALAVVRSAVPPDVRHGWTVERLVERGLPQKLASRVLRVRALWLVRMAPETISKMHVADLRGAYDARGLSLDELRAVYASLPSAFENDGDGKKAEWAEAVREKLVAAAASGAAGHQVWADAAALPFDAVSFEAAAAMAKNDDAVDRASELAAVAEARKAREVPTEGDAWGERVARPAPRRLSGGDGSRAAMVAALHGPAAGPPAGLLDAIKAAKSKAPKPAAAAPVVDLFAELRRTATRVE